MTSSWPIRLSALVSVRRSNRTSPFPQVRLPICLCSILSVNCAGGRIDVIKNTFLSNTDNASIALRRELLESCQLHAVLDCPQGTLGPGVKTRGFVL